MNLILSVAGLVAVTLGLALILLLRRPAVSDCRPSSEWRPRIAWWNPNHPFNRLLDPADFALLREAGLPKARLRVFRRARRRIFRYYLADAVRDFHVINGVLRCVMAQSPTDRPDLAAVIAAEQLRFYRNLLGIHLDLALHACGFDRVVTAGLVDAMRDLQIELRRLVPVTEESVVLDGATG